MRVHEGGGGTMDVVVNLASAYTHTLDHPRGGHVPSLPTAPFPSGASPASLSSDGLPRYDNPEAMDESPWEQASQVHHIQSMPWELGTSLSEMSTTSRYFADDPEPQVWPFNLPPAAEPCYRRTWKQTSVIEQYRAAAVASHHVRRRGVRADQRMADWYYDWGEDMTHASVRACGGREGRLPSPPGPVAQSTLRPMPSGVDPPILTASQLRHDRRVATHEQAISEGVVRQ